MHATFDRLVRFANKCGQIFYGEAPTLAFDPSILIGEEVPVFEGGEPWNPGFKLSGNTQTIHKVNDWANWKLATLKLPVHLMKFSS